MPEQSEKETRRRLGIPEGALQVLVFAESSHWDPDWLLTSREYYSLRIRWILDKAVRELLKDPKRVFSVECIFFFKMYWDRNPYKRDTLRALANEGQIRFSGTGFTQPDTMIPSAEAIIRDFLLGQRWLADNGIESEPRVAYMTDDFGLSPAFPSVCEALGVEYTAGSRVDGHWFPGAEYASPRKFPLPGSTAELLFKELKIADIVWRAPDGAEVLFHVNPKTYGQGDLIAMRGAARWMDIPVGIPARSEKHVSKRVESYVRDLRPFSRTPYMFCPIGFDFNSPITDLPQLLDRYNLARYNETGVYAVLACLEDYMDLVSWHRGALPCMALDPNPNFMGFYFSRPELKRECGRLVSTLLAAEKLGFMNDRGPANTASIREKTDAAWEMAVVTNHHDFVTGTSPNRVYRKEQKPWVARANRLADEALAQSAEGLAVRSGTRVTSSPSWHLEDGLLEVESSHYAIAMDGNRGGCITSFVDRGTGRQLLSGVGNDLVLYEDSGGLWRLGCEFNGGTFRELARASGAAASLRVVEHGGVLRVTVESLLGPHSVTREMLLVAEEPVIRMRVSGSLGDYRTVTCSFSTALRPRVLVMDVTGGVAERPLEKTFAPTFWSAQGFVHFRDGQDGSGLALLTSVPSTVSGGSSGRIEWVVARNARRERAFGFMPLLSHPAAGSDPSRQVTEYAVCATGSGDWRENGLHRLVGRAAGPPWGDEEHSMLMRLADGAVTADSDDVRVAAVKPAEAGEGTVVRLLSFAAKPLTVRLEAGSRAIREASLCDARERDLGALRVEGGAALVPLARSITTVRLAFEGG